ncbi:hypothetical protein Egran_06013, partial [Elaphomyces granulatus]
IIHPLVCFWISLTFALSFNCYSSGPPVKSPFSIALKPTGPVSPGQSSSYSTSRANRFMPPEPIVIQNNVRSRSTPLVPLLPVQHGNDNNNQQPSGIPKISEGSISLSSSPAVARGDTDDVVPAEVLARPLRWVEANDSSTIGRLPNEVLIHVLSHLPPPSLTSMALVSWRFHDLVTAPHAWRIAFSRYFPGTACWDQALATSHPDSTIADRRIFTRLTALASWRSEYILRTRLLRSLSRGKPTQQPSIGKHSVAVVDYSTQLLCPVGHLDANFQAGAEPRFIHGAAAQGTASISDPAAAKTGAWGLTDQRIFQHFADQFPGDAQYGLGSGNLVGLPNVMDVSQLHGMIYGEGCPQGRLYYLAAGERRGRFLSEFELPSEPERGIPTINMTTTAITAVWIAKSPSVPRMTHGLVGILCGSSSGILTAYSLGPSNAHDGRWDRGQVTARWVLSPGVPLVRIVVDDDYSTPRYTQHRIWATVLNALGEVFYLKEIPLPPKPVAKSNLEQLEQLERQAWKTGRSFRWELIEDTRRTVRLDPFNREPVDGNSCPRSSSDAIDLDEQQIAIKTKSVEKFLAFKPKHFQKIYDGWDMRRELLVDFAGGDRIGAGESIVVINCGLEEDQQASIRRFTRQDGLVTNSPPSPSHQVCSSKESGLPSRVEILSVSWRTSDLVFDGHRSIQITANALDLSTYAKLTINEDPLLGMSGISPTSSPASSPLPQPNLRSCGDVQVPGQRARYMAVGTSRGMVYVWNIRAPSSRTRDLINLIPPLHVIQTNSPQISSVALTSLYLVHGGNDGLVQAWDALASSTRPLRTLNARFSHRARRQLNQAQAAAYLFDNHYYAVGAICLDPDPTSLRGLVSLGTQLRYWCYCSSAADDYGTRKRRLRRSLHASNSSSEGQRLSGNGRGALRGYIVDERLELERQKLEDQKERERLSGRFGTDLLGSDASEEELIAYARILSEESYTSDELKRRESEESLQADSSYNETAVAGQGTLTGLNSSSLLSADNDKVGLFFHTSDRIRQSLLERHSESFTDCDPELFPSLPGTCSVSHCGSPSTARVTPETSMRQEQDDLELALRLSLIDARGKLPITVAAQDFPLLESPSVASCEAPINKGKARDI